MKKLVNDFLLQKMFIPSIKPDLWFKDGVCGAFLSFEERSKYDWTNGPKIFRDLIKQNKKN